MKKLYSLKAMFILLMCVNMHVVIQAQNFNLIDIDKYTNSYPRNKEYSAKNAYAYLNGYSYFTADDGIHGRELWKTDGTGAGTKLVKDVNPGTPSSDFDYTNYDIVTSGGKLYFAADGGPGSKGLWVSDGASAGTHFVADVTGGLFLPAYLTDVNGTLFFAVSYFDFNNSNYVNQIWKSDGTAEGTALVADLGPSGYDLAQLINVNGRLFFTFLNFQDFVPKLYTSDGTPDGTYKIDASGSYPTTLTSSNGLLYFIADDGSGGKLWVSDGTAAGSYEVNNNGITCYSTSNEADRDTFAIINNVLYFQGGSFDKGIELCKYDESDPAAGVTIVRNIEPGSNSSYPSFMTNVNGKLFFTVGPAGKDAELWKSNGTYAGTVLVKDINPDGRNSYYGLTNLNGELFFAFGDNTEFNLWKSNGTSAGTQIVKDISVGIYSYFPQFLTASNGLLLFGANDGVNGYELWKSDGTETGTTMIKNINHTSTSSSNPYGFTATANNKVVFSAYDEKYGTELWSTDGTAAGTNLVKDIYPGSFDAPPSFLTKFQNKTYFFANDTSGFHLWRTNGTAGGTKIIPSGLDNLNGYIINMLPGSDLLYIILFNYNTGANEIWRSDGTTGGTYAVKFDFPNFYFINAVVIGNTLFFASDDFTGANGDELWKSEGTAATTGIVKDIYPGSISSYPSELFNFNGKLYFTAADATIPYNALWTSDGTEAGTKIVKPVYVSYTPFAQANGKFFFFAENAISKGFELYASDGTAAGTRIVKDIQNGPNSSGIYNLISGDKLIYFIADDGKHGSELWRSDGTKDGTSIVKDITKGSDGSYIYNMVNVNDKLFFAYNDTLWLSDGTKKGTKPVKDETLDGVSGIGNLTYINGYLYFTGYTYAAGNELYAADLSNDLAPVQKVNNIAAANLNKNEFSARLLTNPVIDQLKITVAVKNQQQATVIITDMSGRILITDKKTLSAGTSILSYNTSAWAKGIYMINIVTSGKFNTTLKALK